MPAKLWGLITFILWFIGISLPLLGLVTHSWNGFGVDSQGRVYVGGVDFIDVYSSGKRVDRIYHFGRYDKRYYITVLPDDTIYLLGKGCEKIISIDGVILSETEMGADKISALIDAQDFYKFTDIHGNNYYFQGGVLSDSVLNSDGDAVYRTPVLYSIHKTIFPISVINLLCFGLVAKKRNWEF